MPLKSKSQMRALFAKTPKVAKEFAAETPSIAKLPEHITGKSKSGGKMIKGMKSTGY
jgi:hypothetical protein